VEVLEYVARKPLVLMTWQGSDAALPSILLNSHTDVVPAEASFWRRACASACMHVRLAR
jgi:aminoacylase